MTAGAEEPGALRSPRAAALLLTLAAALAYHASFRGVFLFDDVPWIVENAALDVLWPPTVAMGETFRPLPFWTFALNRAWSGAETWSYHAVNLALHVAAALALFGVLRRALRLPRAGLDARSADAVALASALLWVVHPLNSQAVIYLIQRAELMAGLAVLGVLLCFLHAVDGTSLRPRAWLAASVACLYAGLGCKEVAAAAPLVVYVADAVLVCGAWRAPLARRAALYAAYAAPFVLAPAWWLLTNPERFVLVRPGGSAPAPLAYLLSQGPALATYVRLVLWPSPLVFDRAWRAADHADVLLPAWLAVGGALLATLVLLRRARPLALPAAAFFLLLAPTSSVFPIADALVEHRTYVASAACIVLVVLAGRAALARLPLADGARRNLATGLCALAAVALAAATVRRSADYTDAARMWGDVVAKAPHDARAHFNLGLEFLHADDAGHEERALRAFERAVALDPTHVKARTNVGALLLARGDVAGAERELRAALALAPDSVETLRDLGHLLTRTGDDAGARDAFARAAEVAWEWRRTRPQTPDVLCELGAAELRLGATDRALAAFRLALDRDTAHAHVRALLQLVVVLTRERDADGALDAARRLAAAAPTDGDVLLQCGRAFARFDRVEEALDAYVAALRAEPGSVAARTELTGVATAPGARERAAAHVRARLAETPADAELRHLADLLALGR